MNMIDYLKLSARTAAGKFFPELVGPRYVYRILSDVIRSSQDLDQIKKALFYRRENLLWSVDAPPFHTPGSYTGIDDDLLHGILGVVTEAGELAELLRDAMKDGKPISEAKLADEMGDALWYMAMIMRKIGVTFEEVGEMNISKLVVRFPEKFSYELVNNKDHAAEDKVFQNVIAAE